MKIYLASTSPRRHQLLANAGFTFEVVSPDTDELERKGETPRSMVRRLAKEKAEAGLLKVRGKKSGVLISADTTVVSPDKKRVLNKPATADEAKRMLRTISGRTHTVLTGYTILFFSRGQVMKRHTTVVKTSVRMRRLTSREIARYVASGEPMDKAGAYGAQGIGMCLIESINGSYSNVVGLPIAELVTDLERKFNVR